MNTWQDIVTEGFGRLDARGWSRHVPSLALGGVLGVTLIVLTLGQNSVE